MFAEADIECYRLQSRMHMQQGMTTKLGSRSTGPGSCKNRRRRGWTGMLQLIWGVSCARRRTGFGDAPNLIQVQCLRCMPRSLSQAFTKESEVQKKNLDINEVFRCEIRPGVKHIF